MSALGQEPVQVFDLPDECRADRVSIYALEEAGAPSFQAVPFYLRRAREDGTKWFDEFDDFTPTDRYRDAVADRADAPISDIRLEREIPTHGFDEV